MVFNFHTKSTAALENTFQDDVLVLPISNSFSIILCSIGLNIFNIAHVVVYDFAEVSLAVILNSHLWQLGLKAFSVILYNIFTCSLWPVLLNNIGSNIVDIIEKKFTVIFF